ncbi:glycosyltransferase family 32 protein [Dothidotthia symphoricarpi CBS 119687]|uniref:Glycosyltransferase family 32 protein n=1 Tax=Dothidotthia symphoricarpi CBS 119687 TaxID=1392245 RepID=A0A6A5ZXY1_9PLEO|nr:glycosyltransferase family 32 protein [Dothidotthia symphoricarpi CBS 119687]KAF2124136.1 glycosyltransferase family 32 protein [Dothidotthia symphoricarpi CBS 119687]
MPPHSPIASHFRSRLTAQVRRVLPAYVVLVVLCLFFVDSHIFTAPFRAAHRHRRELRYQQPLIASTSVIPRKIWQTWKIGPLAFEQRDSDTAKTWPAINPRYRYEVLTDDNANQYVEWHYGPRGFNRPDIVDLWKELRITIIKADLLRYLVMYAEGGVYADIDVESIRPIERFIPERYDEHEVDMIIGIEIDEPAWKDHPILGSKCASFCQWTFAAKPHLPVMMRLIENIQDWLHALSHQKGVPISELKLDFNEVISGTGPSAFTTAVLDQMTAQNKGKKVTWDMFHNLVESRLQNGILVLNVEAFAAGQGHSDSGNHGSRAALVKHHYHASGWPLLHPRTNHPLYGEVEKCNWKPECIHEWDKNVAEWDTLSKEEQDKRIATKPQLPILPF